VTVQDELELADVENPTTTRPPRDNLYRASSLDFELRQADGEGDDGDADGMPTMLGHFARFDEWTEIDSLFEGQFLERIAAGSFVKTFKQNGERIRVLFQHGRDPQIGDKVLGVPEVLREDDEGAYYEVPLFDTGYVRELLPPLEAGAYGASFRFRVLREEINQKPRKSSHNPDRLPERTIKEVEVMEFGPVTFPAYAGATAGIRSLTDEFTFGRLTDDPRRLLEVIEYARAISPPEAERTPEPTDRPAPSADAGEPSHLEPERRDVPIFGQPHEEDAPPWRL
jgi:HK97 family phage prohead protease